MTNKKGDGDKRSVSTDALETLGKLIGPEERRDAIHLAVIPMVSPVDVSRGDFVAADGHPCAEKDAVGIVDPFLPGEYFEVKEGQTYWLVLKPRRITSLRHVWSDPAFGDVSEVYGPPPKPNFTKQEAENKLRALADSWDGPSYESFLRIVTGDVYDAGDGYDYERIDKDFMFFGGSDAHGYIPREAFDYAEIINGKPCVHRPSQFSCSC